MKAIIRRPYIVNGIKKCNKSKFWEIEFFSFFGSLTQNFVFSVSLTDKLIPKTNRKWGKRKIISKSVLCIIVNYNKFPSWQ